MLFSDEFACEVFFQIILSISDFRVLFLVQCYVDLSQAWHSLHGIPNWNEICLAFCCADHETIA